MLFFLFAISSTVQAMKESIMSVVIAFVQLLVHSFCCV